MLRSLDSVQLRFGGETSPSCSDPRHSISLIVASERKIQRQSAYRQPDDHGMTVCTPGVGEGRLQRCPD
jgi:hypothetical protein